MTNSIGESELTLDKTVKTAILYSVPELGSYLVEILHQDNTYFIKENDNHKQFANIALAKHAAFAEGATKGYQAVDKTYQEMECGSPNSTPLSARYDYLEIFSE